ncbi:MAG: hypothetical protein PHV47_01780 [Candidatus Pacebacteria bacterium]|nr:hypothetical protein [Candidatus Paceibacterota bacterium]MDD5621116.1 hypothetical protein [Candidatus Paceibacterota bacterium]
MENKGWLWEGLRPIITGAKQTRAEQPKPTKTSFLNPYGRNRTRLNFQQTQKILARKGGPKYLIGEDNRPIKIGAEERREILDKKVFKGSENITRSEIVRNLRLSEKEIRQEMARENTPSKKLKLREEKKFLKILNPPPRESRPNTFIDNAGTIVKGGINTVSKLLINREIIREKPSEPLDSSVINQNIPKIK